MNKQSQTTIVISKVDHLKPDMIITAYLGLGKKLNNLTQLKCKQLQSTVRGAKVTILIVLKFYKWFDWVCHICSRCRFIETRSCNG